MCRDIILSKKENSKKVDCHLKQLPHKKDSTIFFQDAHIAAFFQQEDIENAKLFRMLQKFLFYLIHECIMFPIALIWAVGKFIKSVGEEYQVWKRERPYQGHGKEYNVKKRKRVNISASSL